MGNKKAPARGGQGVGKGAGNALLAIWTAAIKLFALLAVAGRAGGVR